MDDDFNALMEQAKETYNQHFNGDVWLGRCIFLSFYCSVNTCDFCFRSVSHKSKHDPKRALRSLGSVLSEALLIKAFDWRIEFLTGGYGIMDQDKIARYCRIIHQILGDKLWLNLGVISAKQLTSLKDDIGGVVASLETLEPALHKKTCPDKPIEPYLPMLDQAKELGMQRSITLVIGLGEDRSHWRYAEEFIKNNPLERITLYALRPVKGTPYEKGPSSEDLAWWIAKVRTTFPTIEIIAGTAEYRSEEIPMLLNAGANAITKIPATKLFNTDKGREIESLITSTGRNWVSKLSHKNPKEAMDFNTIIDSLDLTEQEKQQLKNTLNSYLTMMSKASGAYQVDACTMG